MSQLPPARTFIKIFKRTNVNLIFKTYSIFNKFDFFMNLFSSNMLNTQQQKLFNNLKILTKMEEEKQPTCLVLETLLPILMQTPHMVQSYFRNTKG